MSYKTLLKMRPNDVDGVTDWMWVEEDSGAWDGPHDEWMNTHRDAYLNASRERNVVVQAGGNCGLYPRLFAKYFKTVYTFEPDPLNFHCLVNNCQLDNVIKINAAVGETNELVRVERPSMTNVGMHKVHADGEVHVPQFRIDQLGLIACDFIQLDVEGYEIHALRGAIETITRFKPGISCENGARNGIPEFLAPLGYDCVATIGADVVYTAKYP